MALNIFFLVLYVAFSAEPSGDGLGMYLLLILHCVLKLLFSLTGAKRGLSSIHTFYVGVSLISIANIVFLNKIYTHGLKEYYIYSYIIQEYIPHAAFLWAVGSTFIFIGFEMFQNKGFPSLRIDLGGKKGVDILYKIVMFFIFLRFTGNAINLAFITGGLQKIISLLSLMGIMFFARLWVVENSMKYRNYAISICVLQTLAALYTAYLRSDLLLPLVSFYGGYFIGKAKLKYVLSYRIAPLLLIMFIFSIFFNSLGGNRSNFIKSFEEASQEQQEFGVEILNDEVSDRGGVVERNSNVAQLTNAINLVEKNGLYEGRVSYPVMVALIPRVLWPEKPQIQLGAWFALEIGAATITPSGYINNSVNMTVPGELYLDFGWIGVIIGCFLFGAIQAAFWNAAEFNASPYNITGTLWGGYLMLYALFGMGSDLQIITSLLSTYIMFILVKQISKAYENSFDRATVARK